MNRVCLLFPFLFQAVLCIPVVHVVPHSHCDPGYRKSFQEYFDNEVHSIIDTVLIALNDNSSRKFVWEESSFFDSWVDVATYDQQRLFKKLVDEKRLEMIGGGWTMHDEAVNSVTAILNQMTLGLKSLKEYPSVRPKYEWHIDPFGHSLMMPELYSALKYDAIVINRIPDHVKQQMRKDQGLEFIWKSSFTNASMFTHVLDMHYSTPAISGNSTSARAASLASTCNERLKWYRTNQLLLPFGGDFNFQNATKQFVEMEELMDYINQRPDVFKLRMQFSTLSDYFSSVMSTDTTFPVLSDVDFFPYIACYPCYSEACGGFLGSDVPCGIQTPDAYWSGFYTSKPAQKLLVRENEATLSVFEALTSIYPCAFDKDDTFMDYWVEALLTHHDAITGTSFPPAYNDYNQKLNGVLVSERFNIGLLQNPILCKKTRGGNDIGFFFEDTARKLADLTESNVGVISVFNPLLETRSEYIAIQLPEDVCVKVVRSSNGRSNEYQQVGSVLYVPMTIGPMELQTLFLAKIKCPTTKRISKFEGNEAVSNGYLKLTFDENNHLTSLQDLKNGESIDLSLNFTEMLEKKASTIESPHSVCDGTNVYTYVPDRGSKPLSPKNKKINTVAVASGPLVWEIKQEISTSKDSTCPVNVTLRLFKPIEDDTFFKQFIEIQNIVGPLEADYPNSIMFSVETSLNTESAFTTYTSGLYPMRRQYDNSKPPQGNFYPLVGRVSMSDNKRQVAIVMSTKRPMAVSSKEGTLDLLVHRRIKLDNDPRGNDSSVMADPVYLGFVPTNDVNGVSYDAMSHSQSPFTAYAAVMSSLSAWDNECGLSYKPMKNALPKGVKLLGMPLLPAYPTVNFTIGIRLVNINEGSVMVDLSSLFADIPFVYAEETTPDFGINLGGLKDGVFKLPPYKIASALMTMKPKPSFCPL